MALSDDLEPLIDFLRDCLDPEAWDAAMGIIASIASGDAVTAAADSRPVFQPTARDFPLGAPPEMIDRATLREWQRIQQAERETGIVGKTSADATYAAALRQMGLDTAGLTGHANAAKAVYAALKSKPRVKAAMAADAKATARRTEMFPHADRLRINPFS